MGKRVNYWILGSEGSVGAVLYSNSSHNHEDPVAVFTELVRTCAGPTSLAEKALAYRYVSYGGNHRAGDRMFWIDTEQGDAELVIQAGEGESGRMEVLQSIVVDRQRLVPRARIEKPREGSLRVRVEPAAGGG